MTTPLSVLTSIDDDKKYMIGSYLINSVEGLLARINSDPIVADSMRLFMQMSKEHFIIMIEEINILLGSR
jgi:hypothetical protein